MKGLDINKISLEERARAWLVRYEDRCIGIAGAVRIFVIYELSGHEGIAIKRVEQLEEIDGLILPGGESTNED